MHFSTFLARVAVAPRCDPSRPHPDEGKLDLHFLPTLQGVRSVCFYWTDSPRWLQYVGAVTVCHAIRALTAEMFGIALLLVSF